MKLSLDVVKFNLNLLDKVKLDFPILKDFEENKINRNSLYNSGLDSFIRLIERIKINENLVLKLVYDNKISYDELKSKFLELNQSNEKSSKIFANKTEKQFLEIFKNHKLLSRYKSPYNKSYAPALESCETMIFNYLAQNQIEVSSENIFYNPDLWFYKLTKPKFYSRELKITQDFIRNFLEFTNESNLDIRKCNVKTLTNELFYKLEEMNKIDQGSKVKCISVTSNFTLDKLYSVEESQINYYGYLEIRLKNDLGDSIFVPYSNFEEVSRKREDTLKLLGL